MPPRGSRPSSRDGRLRNSPNAPTRRYTSLASRATMEGSAKAPSLDSQRGSPFKDGYGVPVAKRCIDRNLIPVMSTCIKAHISGRNLIPRTSLYGGGFSLDAVVAASHGDKCPVQPHWPLLGCSALCGQAPALGLKHRVRLPIPVPT